MGTAFESNVAAPGNGGRRMGSALAPQVRPRGDATERYQQLADEDRGTGGESLADFLGFFSIGLGLIQVPTLFLNLVLLPPILLGVMVGRWLTRIVPQELFNRLLLMFAGIAALRLLGLF